MEIKLISYNIDGLPHKLDLADLPWLFKPIAWIYKLFKKTTVVTINDNEDISTYMQYIAKYLNSTNADIIALQEDFNYHDILSDNLKNYTFGKYTGGFNLKKLFSSTEWWTKFPLPRFKADGIGFAVNNRVKILSEDIVRWKNYCGYFSHANDALTHKGFRYYTLRIDDKYDIDVCVLHMDADYYNIDQNVKGDVKARKSQLQQLVKYIRKKKSRNPLIIIGDTNSSPKYEWDVENLKNNLLEPLSAEEAYFGGYEDVDRVFYVNNSYSDYKLEPIDCNYGFPLMEDGRAISDHWPLWVRFKIVEK